MNFCRRRAPRVLERRISRFCTKCSHKCQESRMKSATERPRSQSNGTAGKWLEAYRRMMSIRLFEESVNDLYTRAIMPGLAHLYIGEEAVAVGICEALRKD